jgi:outer membrane protein assembly factor BamB
MDPRLYKEVLFPGYEEWNAAWDLHASGSSVYIALCAEGIAAKSARLFRYDVRTGDKRMILDPDRAAGIRLESGAMPQSKFHTAIRTLRDGRLFMVTHNTAAGRFHPDWQLENMRHDPTGFSSRAFIYDPARDQVTYLGAPIPDEDIYYGRLDAELNLYYACGYSTRTLYQIDLSTGTAIECGDHPCWIAIVVDGDHIVYTSDARERIWRWDPFRKKSEMTGLRMPHGPYQKESEGSWVYGWKDPDGWIYAVPQYCNRICRFKPKEGLMQDLGNGWRENPERPGAEWIFAPVRARNGRIYYGVLGGTPPYYEDGTEIIELDPETGKRRNLGTMRLSDGTLACVLGEGALGSDGRIYWGDGNHGGRGAMMWVFDPRNIPEDYRPAGSARRNPRYRDGIDSDSYRYPRREVAKPSLWRWTPLPGPFSKSEFSADASLRGGKVERIPLEECGFPMGENAVCGLVRSTDGSLYGIAGDERPTLFRLPRRALRAEALASIPGGKRIINGSVIASSEGSVFLAGKHVFRWTAGSGLSVFAPMEGENRPVALASDAAAARLYVLIEPANRLLVLESKTAAQLRAYEIPGYIASRWLVPAKGGGVFGFENNGTVYRIGPDGKRTRLADRVPATRGLEFICEVTSAAGAPDGRVWGGTREGYLFSIEADGSRVINHGKPGTYYLKGVAVVGDAVYCFGGGDFGDTHLHRFRIGGGFEDLGLMSRRLVSAAVPGEDGSVWAGEFSSASALLRFLPAER